MPTVTSPGSELPAVAGLTGSSFPLSSYGAMVSHDSSLVKALTTRAGMRKGFGGEDHQPRVGTAKNAGLDYPAPSRTRAAAPDRAAWEPRPRLTLLSYQVAKTRRIGSAAECSNQTDLQLTLIDPIRPSDLPRRPSLTSMPLATDQKIVAATRPGRHAKAARRADV